MTRTRAEDKVLFVGRVAEMAKDLSSATQRKVGCVLFDAEFRHLVVAYNGAPRGVNHGAWHARRVDGGATLDLHAEVNALKRCGHLGEWIGMVVTAPPCERCAGHMIDERRLKLVLCTGQGDAPMAGTELLLQCGVRAMHLGGGVGAVNRSTLRAAAEVIQAERARQEEAQCK